MFMLYGEMGRIAYDIFNYVPEALFTGVVAFAASWGGVKRSVNGMREDIREIKQDVKELRDDNADVRERVARLEGSVDKSPHPSHIVDNL